jgi:hypothetical protein
MTSGKFVYLILSSVPHQALPEFNKACESFFWFLGVGVATGSFLVVG